MRRYMREAKMTLEDPKADKPEKSGEMPSKYELCWSEFDDKGEIVEKDKSFSSLEKFIEFKEELELEPSFLQINGNVVPSFMDELPKAKSEEMEKVKIKESNKYKRKSTMRSLKEEKLRKLIRMMVLKEMTGESAMTSEKKIIAAKLKSMNWPELKKYLKQDGHESFITSDQDATVDDLVKSLSIGDLKSLAG